MGDAIRRFVAWVGEYWMLVLVIGFWLFSNILGWAGARGQREGTTSGGWWLFAGRGGGFGGGGGGGSFGGGFSGGGGASGGW